MLIIITLNGVAIVQGLNRTIVNISDIYRYSKDHFFRNIYGMLMHVDIHIVSAAVDVISIIIIISPYHNQ